MQQDAVHGAKPQAMLPTAGIGLVWKIIAFGWALRICAFIGMMFFPFPYSDAGSVGPLLMQRGAETESTYIPYAQQYLLGESGGSKLFNEFRQYYFDYDPNRITFIPGPAFPIVLTLFDYKEGNTLPLALTHLLLSCLLLILWIYWLHGKGVRWPWLCVIAALPNPVWYAVYVSSDAWFYIASVTFFITLVGEWPWRLGRRGRQALLGGSLLLAVVCRPSSVSLICFAGSYILLERRDWLRTRWPQVAAFALLSLGVAIYYAPYFLTYQSTAPGWFIFGMNMDPKVLDWNGEAAVSSAFHMVKIYLGKMLYIAGYHPSDSNNLYATAIRYVMGLPLLIGLIAVWFKGELSHKLFVFWIILPQMLGFPATRYNLPIFPVLVLAAARATEPLLRRALGSGSRSGA